MNVDDQGILEQTFRDADSERASGNLLPSEGHTDGVRALQDGDIGAAENTVTSVLQHNLHCVPPAVGVHDDDAYVPGSRPWGTETQQEDFSLDKGRGCSSR